MQSSNASNRDAPAVYYPNETVYVDATIGKDGNAAKLGINRPRAVIMDKISENVYVIKYENGRVEPINVDRLYTLSAASQQDIEQNSSKSAKRNRQKAAKRMNRRQQQQDKAQQRHPQSSHYSKSKPPRKRRRIPNKSNRH